ncbi:cobaltochelatase subunit CobN, partial [Oharaeibacter diazotrophicus]
GLAAAPPADAADPEPLPAAGFYRPGAGALAEPPAPDGRPEAVVVFYRSYLLAADTAPVDALLAALEARGFAAHGLFVTSLKDPAAAGFVRTRLAGRPVAAIVSATAFSARGDDGATPFDGLGAPVFQVALSTARRRDWAASTRGLSPADLAMHVVLPEVDGRIFAGVASFKAPTARDPDTQYSRFVHRPDPGRIAAIADRIAARRRLAATPAAARRIALVLSTYPGRQHLVAHAVGLDALASAAAVLEDLAAAGHRTAPAGDLVADLSARTGTWPVAAYEATLAGLPEAARAALAAAWGDPAADPAVADGAFRFAATTR